MNLKSYLYILTLISLSGCESFQEPETSGLPKVPSPSEQLLITTEMLQHVSTTCRQQIDQLWQKRFSVPKEKQKDFYEMMGRAVKDCNVLDEAFKYLQSMSSHYANYQQSFKNAHSFIGELPLSTVSQSHLPSETALLEVQPLK